MVEQNFAHYFVDGGSLIHRFLEGLGSKLSTSPSGSSSLLLELGLEANVDDEALEVPPAKPKKQWRLTTAIQLGNTF